MRMRISTAVAVLLALVLVASMGVAAEPATNPDNPVVGMMETPVTMAVTTATQTSMSREQRLEERKAELRKLVESRKAEVATQLGASGANTTGTASAVSGSQAARIAILEQRVADLERQVTELQVQVGAGGAKGQAPTTAPTAQDKATALENLVAARKKHQEAVEAEQKASDAAPSTKDQRMELRKIVLRALVEVRKAEVEAQDMGISTDATSSTIKSATSK